MRLLPIPIGSDDQFVLVVALVLAMLRDKGPYPVTAVSGEQGSAKTTFSAILRALLDPNTAPLRALPREDRDLFIAATQWVRARLRQCLTPAGLDLRHALPASHRRRLRSAPVLH